MNDNVRKVFDILGVEPNEKFRILDVETEDKPSNYIPLNGVYYIDKNLFVHIDGSCKTLPRALRPLLNGTYKIIKLPKKKKLRDLTTEEYKHWQKKNCDDIDCNKCIFFNISCHKYHINCWIDHKDLFSDEFLDQEIEVEE